MKLELTLSKSLEFGHEFPQAIASTHIDDFEDNRDRLPAAIKRLVQAVKEQENLYDEPEDKRKETIAEAMDDDSDDEDMQTK